LLAGLVFAAITAFTPAIFNDGDTWVHIAAGERMVRLGGVLHTDPFTYTFLGKPWQTHEWLAEVVMALSYRWAGWAGESLLFALAAGATAALLTRHLGRWLGGLPLVIAAALALDGLAPAVLARPHILATPFLEMWTAELVIARAASRTPSWARLAPLMIVWANLHGSFMFGLGLLGAFGLDSMWTRRTLGARALPPWLWLCPLMVVASVVSPHGIDNLTFPLRLASMPTVATIDEWKPIDPDRVPAFEEMLLAGVFVLAWKGLRIAIFPLLLLLLLAHLTLHHARHLVLFAIVAPLLIAEPFAAAFRSTTSPIRWTSGWTLFALASTGCLAAARLSLDAPLPDRPVAPATALAQVPASLRREPVYNGYRFGAFLIFNGVRPYIDSRAEVFGDAFHNQFLRLQGGDLCAFGVELAKRRIAWTILEPHSALLPYLDGATDWRRIYADRFAVIHAHQGDSWSGPPTSCGPARSLR
jgi:hypothetical protein